MRSRIGDRAFVSILADHQRSTKSVLQNLGNTPSDIETRVVPERAVIADPSRLAHPSYEPWREGTMEWFRRTRQEISRRIAETPAPGRWPGIVVVVLGLLLTGWFFLDGVLGNPALPKQYQLVQGTMLLLASLA